MAKNTRNISIRKLIFNDKYLIITALILALLVWITTSLNIGTDETRTINIDVPIKISDDLSNQLGMKYYSLQSSVDIDVTISGAKYVIGQVNENDLSIKFDTSSVNRAGEQSIPIHITNKSNTKDFTVTSVYPSSIDAFFDVEESESFDISLVYNQENAADGYVFGTPVISEDKVVVTGPKSYVDVIDRVVAEVDFGKEKELKETFVQECPLTIKGSGVEPNYLTLTSRNNENEALESISVTLPVLKETYLPVAVDFEDEPSELIKNSVKTKFSTDKINVGILESTDISNAVIGKINYNELSVGVNKFTFDTNDIQGVFIIDDGDNEINVTVTVSDDYKEITLPIKTSDVTVKGVADGATASVTSIDSSRLTLVVPKDVELQASDIKLSVDVSEESEDEMYPINITLNNKASWAKSTYNATVKIDK